uniref:Uncharacterized protein n=1 Tax=Rhizophora mucronata TaxID=61149 RepID=A0A2P2PG28_RHIMU
MPVGDKTEHLLGQTCFSFRYAVQK